MNEWGTQWCLTTLGNLNEVKWEGTNEGNAMVIKFTW